MTSEESLPIRINTPRRPINLALKSIQRKLSYNGRPEPEVENVDDRTIAIQLHDAGQSIEEIAKKLGKGQTEVELILKFR